MTTYTAQQRDQIRTVVRDALGKDIDQITTVVRVLGSVDVEKSLWSRIEAVASAHITRSAIISQMPGYKTRIKKLKDMRDRAEALHVDIIDAQRPSFTLGGDDRVRRVILGGDLAKYSPNVDPFDDTGRAIATLVSVIEASIAAQRPPTASASKTARDECWTELLAIWRELGGKPTGIAAAAFIRAASRPVMGNAVPDIPSIRRWLDRRNRAIR